MTSAPDRIYLTGFMAAGKSTVGRLLAARLGYAFVDLDIEIERGTKRSIRQIFSEDGEPAFRRVEAETLDELSRRSRIVVSTGGGALATPVAMAGAKRSGLVIFLDVPERLLVERILRSRRRPLIEHIRSGGEPAVSRFVRETLEQRRPIYDQAHVTIETGTESPESITHEILEALRQLSLNDRR
jgi:shikimate kinase